MKKGILFLLFGIIIGLFIGVLITDNTNPDDYGEIIRTKSDSFEIVSSEIRSFDIFSCNDYLLNKTSTPENVKDLECRINDARRYGDNLQIVCWCDFN